MHSASGVLSRTFTSLQLTTLRTYMAGPKLRLQCSGAVYEALTSSGVELPYLLNVACGDYISGEVIACPNLSFDYEASFWTGL